MEPMNAYQRGAEERRQRLEHERELRRTRKTRKM